MSGELILIGPVPVERDQDGWWEHPGLPDFDEDDHAAFRAWITERRLELRQWLMESDLNSDEHHYWTEESCSCEGWNPESPGPEWFLLGIFDTEDGPCVSWARRVAAGEGVV